MRRFHVKDSAKKLSNLKSAAKKATHDQKKWASATKGGPPPPAISETLAIYMTLVITQNHQKLQMGNWRTKLRNAVDACIKDQGEEEHPFAFIADDTAVEAACDQLATITDEKRHKVLDAVQAFHSFLASINDSFIRFCHVEC
uniref:Uncharacterized protein n=1 Tax=Romanomermis culicivorax TaxID=13658 RepID=A0A915JVJ7_ROMCU